MILLVHNNMQNKNSFLQTHYSQPSQRCYRSVRYKINASTTTNPNQTHYTPFKSQRTASSWKKHNQPSTAFPNTTDTVFNPETSLELDQVEIKKPYLQTWHRLLHSHEEKEPPKAPRVFLPQIIDY